MPRERLIDTACKFIDKGFMEDSLRVDAKRYVEFKFNQSINFAKLTEIHFDIFRENKNSIHKMKAMTIVELIILASDILDDIQDRDAKDVPWSNVDDAFNLNIVVGMLIICLQETDGIAGVNETLWIKQKIKDLMLQSLNGQQIDLKNEIISEDDYIQMCNMKSGSLIRLACLVGAGKVDDEINKGIKEYANYLGVIFQLRNDVLDMKNGFIKNDILSKKRTLPIIYYLNTKNEAYDSIKDYYLNSSSNLDAERIQQDLMSGDALLYCSIVIKIFLNKFKVGIDNLKTSHRLKQQLFTAINIFLKN
ncbi:polyprenyl synthetase family protein [Pseudogracilibacillus auburnensis]|uniref:Competence protein ComQ n=1 Tax=Pseudogracilibacillus auburnensis TaxID=1494959 RepID=A0A2V3VUB3_9BACI|nr:polyprenyl synthetase family protein [Pseudogracilibacillus auburnensis]PXW85260.1 competence protein ComQ [Pseudogracilibacillus auburnensis]